jgi:hypothetical protein
MLLPVVRRSLLISALVVGSACLLAAQYPMPIPHTEPDTKSADIRALVSKYCRLDYGGARLDGQGWARMQPLVTWQSNPKYTEINVIARYGVDPEPVGTHGKYTVTVHYRLLGSYNLTTGYLAEAPGTVQDVQYTVTDTNGELQISDTENNMPHPSRAAMLEWLSGRLTAAQDEHAKTRYQEALRRLQAQPASPFAK